MPAVERLIAMGLQFKLAEINEGRVQEKEGERILVVISWQSFASIIIIIWKARLSNSLSSRPLGERAEDKMSPKLTRSGKKRHRVYCCNTPAAPNTPLAEPCSTDLALLEKLNNSLHARDHIHHLGAGYGKIYRCGLNRDLSDSLAELQRHSLLLQSTEGSACIQTLQSPQTSLDASHIQCGHELLQ